MNLLMAGRGWLGSHTDAIGFWAGILTTISFAPQLLRTWRMGGEALSWAMLALFGTGVGLWFVYGVLLMSGPLMLANGLTELQILCILALKLRDGGRSVPRTRI